jgi:hypothetical protein
MDEARLSHPARIEGRTSRRQSGGNAWHFPAEDSCVSQAPLPPSPRCRE